MFIKMTANKDLVITIPTTIYRGETKADLITFLLPMEYEGQNMADCAVSMRYILPGGTGYPEALSCSPEPHNGYLQYSTIVNTRLTSEVGKVTIWLTAFDSADQVLIKTGEVLVQVHPSKDIASYMPKESLDQLDQMAAQIQYLDQVKADNMTFNRENEVLRLTSNGQPIGDEVHLTDTINEDDVIHFGPGSSGDSSGGSSDDSTGDSSGDTSCDCPGNSTDADSVIYF